LKDIIISGIYVLRWWNISLYHNPIILGDEGIIYGLTVPFPLL
jgi:hypothetical protein